jgi:DNA (cytosine-5)-methyltransferase 1
MNYYNEWDKPTAAWLQELINQGLILNGHIDTRSIADVQPADLAGYTQCHFFAGIGGWPLALDLAGWPRTRPVWTGSCPCQPFSAAGKRKGQDDERHLWPEFFRLIRECGPDAVFGEQVEGAVGHGWLDGVFADLEGEGYACGAAVLGAHSAGAPHMRQRLYWVADAQCRSAERHRHELAGATCGVQGEAWERQRIRYDARDGGTDSGLGNPDSPTKERLGIISVSMESQQEAGRPGYAVPWQGTTTIPCADGKSRRVKPGIQLLAHGVPARVVRLRGYGNAIVPACAAEFIGAYMECLQ